MEKPIIPSIPSGGAESTLMYLPDIINACERSECGRCHEMKTYHTKRHIMIQSNAARDDDQLTITSPTGEVELEIRITATGPVLLFSAIDIQLTSIKRIELAAEEIALKAGKSLTAESRGSRVEMIDGDLVTKSESVDVRATLGGVCISANDDVSLNGERIFLNK